MGTVGDQWIQTPKKNERTQELRAPLYFLDKDPNYPEKGHKIYVYDKNYARKVAWVFTNKIWQLLEKASAYANMPDPNKPDEALSIFVINDHFSVNWIYEKGYWQPQTDHFMSQLKAPTYTGIDPNSPKPGQSISVYDPKKKWFVICHF